MVCASNRGASAATLSAFPMKLPAIMVFVVSQIVPAKNAVMMAAEDFAGVASLKAAHTDQELTV